MKKKLLILLAILTMTASAAQATFITSSSDPALSGSSLIDFNSQAIGSYASLAIGDVTFSGSGPVRVTSDFAGDYNSNGIHLDNDQGNTYTLNFSFNQPVSAFGFNLGASDVGDWVLTAFAGGTPLDSFLLPATWYSNSGDFFGIAGNGITSATLSSSSYDYVLLDNFRYQTGGSEPVPEPSTIFLLGAGLAGIGLIRRKAAKA